MYIRIMHYDMIKVNILKIILKNNILSLVPLHWYGQYTFSHLSQLRFVTIIIYMRLLFLIFISLPLYENAIATPIESSRFNVAWEYNSGT